MLTIDEKIANAVFALLLIAGGLSLQRFADVPAEYSILVELRTWLIFALLVFVLLNFRTDSHAIRLLRSPGLATIAILFVLAHALVLLSLLWSRNPEAGFFYAYDILLLLAVVFIGFNLAVADPEESMRIWCVSSWLIACLVFGFGFASSGSLIGESADIGAGGIGLSRLNATAVLGALWLHWRYGQIWWLLPIPVLCLGIMLSGSRIALIALLVAAAAWWILPHARSIIGATREKWRMARAGVLVILASAAVVFAAKAIEIIILFGKSLLVSTGNSGQLGGIYLADRDIIFADAVRKIVAHPESGLGLGTYLGPVGELYPHNLILGYAVDAGVVAGLLIVIVAAFGVYRSVLSNQPHTRGAFVIAAFFGISSLFAGSYYDARSMWAFLLLSCLTQHKYAAVAAARLRAEPC